MERSPIRIHPAVRDDIGDLVTRRPVPGPGIEHVDPFLFLNHHGPQIYPPRNNGLPFGPHPHRGFETVTFILDGELAHRDSGGHESVIHAGGVQWMTAGRGLVHAELSPQSFKDAGGRLEILQLWLNLPARLKMVDPAYVGLERDQIPVVSASGGRARIHLIAGSWGDQSGVVQPLTDVEIMLVELEADAMLDLRVASGRSVFLYIVRGAANIGGRRVARFQLAELSDGDAVRLAADEPALILLGHATPYREPIVAHGPFVMNSREEIVAAMRDYQAGRLGAL